MEYLIDSYFICLCNTDVKPIKKRQMIINELISLTSITIAMLILTGLIVGFLLALTGGGGSVVCVPLLLYLVKIKDTHMVIGISAMAVAISALINLFTHTSSGNVRWKNGIIISVIAVFGAFIGASLGKMVSGQYLLLPFSVLMLVTAFLMLRKTRQASPSTRNAVSSSRSFSAYFVVFSVGVLAGFLGIGGGFLVVPVLIWLFGFTTLEAIATSLMVVFAMGISTSISYAMAGKVDPVITIFIIVGGILGGRVGVKIANRLKEDERVINLIFSVMLIMMSLYMLIKNL